MRENCLRLDRISLKNKFNKIKIKEENRLNKDSRRWKKNENRKKKSYNN